MWLDDTLSSTLDSLAPTVLRRSKEGTQPYKNVTRQPRLSLKEQGKGRAREEQAPSLTTWCGDVHPGFGEEALKAISGAVEEKAPGDWLDLGTMNALPESLWMP